MEGGKGVESGDTIQYSVYRIIPAYSNKTTKSTEPSTKDLPLAWLLH